MKYRILSFFLVCVLFISAMTLPVYAAEISVSDECIITFEDGSYLEVTIIDAGSRASGTKSGQKVTNYRDSDGVLQWQAVLSGTFTYTGSTATCTSASCSVTISDSDWYVDSKTTTRSGNTATTQLTMGQKFVGVTINKHSYTITLTCDKDGNLS